TTCPTSSNTITLSSGGIYEFTNSDNSTDGGNMLPVIASPITINGNGASFVPDGEFAARYFDVASGANLTLNSVILQNGYSSSSNGGAILNAGSLTLSYVTLNSNSASSGGSLYNTGTTNINHSTISRSFASNVGGGIDNVGGSIHLVNTTVADNNATANGSQFYLGGGTATLDFTTIYDGSSQEGANFYISGSGSATIKNILNVVNGGYACGGSAASAQGTNVTNDNTCSGYNIVVGDPGVADLANNGGSTETDALYGYSPAIDSSDCLTSGGQSVSDDQRGITRPQDAGGYAETSCDAGAYEYVPAPG
ncbi:MAG TPA: choice-of-anchor Q domain-containing protein, partial [Phototrophicaceae bacterium]|nr:choice-of-anchor Q domain-containing protein [Phototrophicaceae bacterium]